VTAGTVKDAAAADIVVLAVIWPDVPKAVEGLGWEGRFVIDPTNDFDPSDLEGRTSSAERLGASNAISRNGNHITIDGEITIKGHIRHGAPPGVPRRTHTRACPSR
jgi:hypothetical protein